MSGHRRFAIVVAALAAFVSAVTLTPTAVSAQPHQLGDPFLIAAIPAGGSYLSSTQAAYDAERDRSLIVMLVHPSSGIPWSILTQLVEDDGQPVPGGQGRVNAVQALHANPANGPSFWDNRVSVAFNPDNDEYLVMWGQSTGPNSAAASGARWSLVYSQRYSAITGQPVGTPLQVTPARGSTAGCSVFDPVVRHNPADGGYLAVIRYGLFNGSGGEPECPDLPDGQPYRLELARLTPAGALAGSLVPVPGSGSRTEEGYTTLVRHPGSGEFLLAYRYTQEGVTGQTNVLQRVSSSGQPIGGGVTIDPDLQRGSAWAAARPDGNWLVLGYVIGGAVKAYVYSPTLQRIGERRDVPLVSGVTQVAALGDGTFVMRDVDTGYLLQLGPNGAPMGERLSAPHADVVVVGRAGAPVLAAGRGAQGTDLRNAMAGVLVTFGPGDPVAGGGIVQPGTRRCIDVAGAPGDVALVNITPVAAQGPGNGQLVASDVVSPPQASNVNFGVGTVDPNVAAAPIGSDGQVCFVNSDHSRMHVILDHLGTVAASSITLATPSGAPDRKVDTRQGLGGGLVGPSGRVCFAVAGAPGDVALVNLTPVEAQGGGNGQLISSDVTTPPVASNVNFGVGTIDPNVAAAPIGADGQVCYVNSSHTSVHLIADHLATIAAHAITLATPSGAPERKVDTRSGQGGGLVAPSGRVCFGVAGAPGDVALVNLTPVEAQGLGNGQLVSSDVTSPPEASNVNFGVGTVDPNVAAAPIGADGQVCYVNSSHTSVHLIADHLGTIDSASFKPASASGAPARRIDTRG